MQLTVAKFAKEINKETAEVVAVLKARGDEIKGSNTISDEQMEYVKNKIGGTKPTAAPAAEKKAEAPVQELPEHLTELQNDLMNLLLLLLQTSLLHLLFSLLFYL